MIDLYLKLADGQVLEAHVQGAEGFALLGPVGCWWWAHGNGMSIVLCNGLVDEINPAAQAGPLTGQFTVAYGGETKHSAEYELHDGCPQAIRMGEPPLCAPLPPEYLSFVTEGWDGVPVDARISILNRLAAYNFTFDDAKYTNPDVPGSPRVCQSQWAGAVAYALTATPEAPLAAARAFTDQQRRPCVYFTANGELFDHPGLWIDQSGMRKGLHGKWNRKTTSQYQLEDPEHLAPDRFFLAAAAGDPIASFYSRAYVHAILTRPSVATTYPPQQARAVGLTFETLAKWKRIAGDEDGRLQTGASRLLEALNFTRGFGIAGIPFMAMWPPLTIHATHVGPTMLDAHAFAYQHELALSPSVGDIHEAITDLEQQLGQKMTEPAMLQWLLRGVTVWGIAIILRGLQRAIAAGFKLDLAPYLADECSRLIEERGAAQGTWADGTWLQPSPLHESIAPRCWRVYPTVGTNGTDRYCVPGLEASQRQTSLAIGKRLWFKHSSFKLSDKSLAAIETGGLPAIARWGLRP